MVGLNLDARYAICCWLRYFNVLSVDEILLDAFVAQYIEKKGDHIIRDTFACRLYDSYIDQRLLQVFELNVCQKRRS